MLLILLFSIGYKASIDQIYRFYSVFHVMAWTTRGNKTHKIPNRLRIFIYIVQIVQNPPGILFLLLEQGVDF